MSLLKKLLIPLVLVLAALTPVSAGAKVRTDMKLSWDRSFGRGGLAYIHGNGDDQIATAPDGGFGMFALQEDRVIWLRLDRNGHRVRSYAKNGALSVPLAPYDFPNGKLSGAEFDSRGGALLMVEDFKPFRKPRKSGSTVIRVTPSGRLDRRFGGDGKVWLPALEKSGYREIWNATLIRGGKILVSGQDSDQRSFTLRLKADGSRDRGYGSKGTSRARDCASENGEQSGFSEFTPLRSDGSYYALKICADKPETLVFVDAEGVEHPRLLPFSNADGKYPQVLEASLDTRGRTLQVLENRDGESNESFTRLTATAELDTSFGTNGFLSAKAAGIPDVNANEVTSYVSGLKSGGADLFRIGLDDEERRIRASAGVISSTGSLLGRARPQWLKNTFLSVDGFTHEQQPKALFVYGTTRNGTGLKKLVLSERD